MAHVLSYVKTREDFEREKSEFMSYYNYLSQVDPDNVNEWFDEDYINLYISGKLNPHFFSSRSNPGYNKVSMVRVPTRCPECKRAWAIEAMERSRFRPNFLDQSVYKNIPLEKGVCHECK
jgi:hypothetical protein